LQANLPLNTRRGGPKCGKDHLKLTLYVSRSTTVFITKNIEIFTHKDVYSMKKTATAVSGEIFQD
jgi:hypothetical protein